MDRTKKTMEPGYSELLDGYQRWLLVDAQISTATWKTYRHTINAFVHRLQDERLPLSAKSVLVTDRASLEQKFSDFAKTVSPESARSAAAKLDRFFSYLLKSQLVSAKPEFERWTSTPRGVPDRLSNEIVKRIFEHLPSNEISWVEARDRAILQLYYHAERKPTELFVLKVGDFDGRRLRLSNALDRSRKFRELDASVSDALIRYLELVPFDLSPEDLLFRHHWGRRAIDAKGHWRYLYIRAEQLGLRYSPKLLRASGIHARLMTSFGPGARKSPQGWMNDWEQTIDFDELLAAFKSTHPRWQ